MNIKTPLSIILLSSVGFGPVLADNPGTHGDPYTPVGSLNVSKRIVRTGAKPMLSWEITYPSEIDDIVEIDPKSRITPKKDVLMEVRVVGAAFQSGETHTPVALQSRVGTGAPWQPLFEGVDSTVDASDIVLSQVVPAGTAIDFAAQGQGTDGSWYASRDTLTSDIGVQAMKNGAEVPAYVPAYNQDTIESFLNQYISEDNVVTIGPRDLIFLFELWATDQSSSAFDMQDIVVVVTFKDVPKH